MKEKPCEHISPAGLSDRKTTKDAIKYLKEKECPRVDEFKRTTAAPVPVDVPSAPVVVPSVVPPDVEAPKKKGRPVKPKEPKKRQPSAYALAFGEARKSGKTFAEATAQAKEVIAKMKEKPE